MPFPTTTVLDDFNTGANQALSTRAGWSASHCVGFGDFTTDAVPTKAVSASQGDNIWGTQFTDVEAYFTIADWTGGSGSWQLYARFGTAAAQNGYRVSHFTGTILLQTVTGGGTSNLASASLTLAAGDAMGISCIGSLITGYTKVGAGDWTAFGSATDATYAGPGNIGAVAQAAGLNMDSFGGGAFVTGGAPARDTHTAIPFTKGAGGGGKI